MVEPETLRMAFLATKAVPMVRLTKLNVSFTKFVAAKLSQITNCVPFVAEKFEVKAYNLPFKQAKLGTQELVELKVAQMGELGFHATVRPEGFDSREIHLESQMEVPVMSMLTELLGTALAPSNNA